MPKNRNTPRDAKVQPSDLNKIEGPLISYSNVYPPGKALSENQCHHIRSGHLPPRDSLSVRPAGLPLDTTTTSTYQPQPLPRAQPPKRDNAHSEITPTTRQHGLYCPKHAPLAPKHAPLVPKHAPLAPNMPSNPNPKPNSGKISPTTRTHSHNPKKTSEDDRKSHGPPISKSPKTGAAQVDKSHKPHIDSRSMKPEGTNGKVGPTASPRGGKVRKTADDEIKAAKRNRPEVTSIPQTNMSIGLLVFCCFNPLLGALAIYLSLTAAKAYRDGDDRKGASRAHWSILMSLFGIMITMVIVSSLVVFFAVNKHTDNRYRSSISLPQGL